MKARTLSIGIAAETLRLLEEVCEKKELSKAQFVRFHIEKALGLPEPGMKVDHYVKRYIRRKHPK